MMPRTSRARGGSTRIQKITPSSIEVADDPAPQEFSIKIDPKELKKAIAQLEKREEQIKKRLEARKKARK